jgi:hypothetical protein
MRARNPSPPGSRHAHEADRSRATLGAAARASAAADRPARAPDRPGSPAGHLRQTGGQSQSRAQTLLQGSVLDLRSSTIDSSNRRCSDRFTAVSNAHDRRLSQAVRAGVHDTADGALDVLRHLLDSAPAVTFAVPNETWRLRHWIAARRQISSLTDRSSPTAVPGTALRTGCSERAAVAISDPGPVSGARRRTS